MATDVTLQRINMMTQEQFESLIDENGKVPSLANQLVMTDSKAKNVSQVRVELLYDKDISAKNWGYPDGIPTGTTISNKDFSKYEYLKVYSVRTSDDYGSNITLVPLNKTQDGGGYVGRGVCYLARLSSVNSLLTTTITTVVNGAKTGFTVYFTQSYNTNDYYEQAYRVYRVEGVLKEPAMIYTGAELHEGNGIKINNGVVSSDSGYLLLSAPFTSSTIHTIQTELTEGTYDIFITGNASTGTDMYFYVNGDQSATYFWNAYQTYHASSAVTGGGKAWTNSFYMGSMFIYESRYHITLTITRESGVMFSSVGGGIDQNQYYARSIIGSKASVSNYTINSITFGSSNSSVATAGNLKIYKRY